LLALLLLRYFFALQEEPIPTLIHVIFVMIQRKEIENVNFRCLYDHDFPSQTNVMLRNYALASNDKKISNYKMTIQLRMRNSHLNCY